MKKQGTNLSLRQLPRYEYNPFVFPEDRAVTIQKGSDGKIISNGNESDPFKVKGMVRVREVDNEKFVKIYTNHISMWFELSSAGQRVLQYIMTILPRDTDKINFNLGRAMAYTGYSSTVSLYEGLAELIKQKIIARTENPGLYFINPRFLFNGDRVVFAEAIMRNPQAIQERTDLLKSINEPPPGYRDVEAPDSLGDYGDVPAQALAAGGEAEMSATGQNPGRSFFDHLASMSE